jgi:hypothetical protein
MKRRYDKREEKKEKREVRENRRKWTRAEWRGEGKSILYFEGLLLPFCSESVPCVSHV